MHVLCGGGRSLRGLVQGFVQFFFVVVDMSIFGGAAQPNASLYTGSRSYHTRLLKGYITRGTWRSKGSKATDAQGFYNFRCELDSRQS